MRDTTAPYDYVAAFSETDLTEDLEAMTVPVLFLHGENDQIVPIKNSAHRAIKLVRIGTRKTYPGLFATHPDLINTDLLAFIREARSDSQMGSCAGMTWADQVAAIHLFYHGDQDD